MSKKAILVSFGGSAHFFSGKEPKDFAVALQRDKFISLPSGSIVATSGIQGVYTYEDYRNIHETAERHKRHEWLSSDGNWRDGSGAIVEKADITRLIQKADQHAIQETNQRTLRA